VFGGRAVFEVEPRSSNWVSVHQSVSLERTRTPTSLGFLGLENGWGTRQVVIALEIELDIVGKLSCVICVL